MTVFNLSQIINVLEALKELGIFKSDGVWYLQVWLFILKKGEKEFSCSSKRHQISLNNLPEITNITEIVCKLSIFTVRK